METIKRMLKYHDMIANMLNIFIKDKPIIYGETKGNYYYNRILDFISIRQAKKYRKKTLVSACKT